MPNLDNESLAVIDKVRKLLALAGNNPNEAEAAAASAKAMEILASYNLDMAVVEQGGATGKREDTYLSGGLYQWQRELWYHVAELNFCMYWWMSGQRKGNRYQHRILGRKENVIGAQIMAEYLQTTIERLAREKAGDGSKYFIRSMIAYREGMADRLTERLEEARRAAEHEEAAKARERAAQGDTSMALVVLDDVRMREHAANYDHINGAGAWDRKEAKDKSNEEALARASEEYRQWVKDHPEEAAKQEAEWAKTSEKYSKRQYRERAATDRERRMSTNEYFEGRDRADTISLDRQVGEGGKAGRIKA